MWMWLLGSPVIATVCYLGWVWLTVLVPRGLHRPVVTRIIMMMLQIHRQISKIRIALGWTTVVQLARQIGKRMKKTEEQKKAHDFEEIRDTTFDGVKVRLYLPKRDESHAKGHRAIVHLHGGGWVMGEPELFDDFMSDLTRGLPMVIASVDYRLAPEVTYPEPLEDCLKATRYFLEHAGEFGADPERVAILGDSAGGNLAAAVALKLRDDGFEPRLKQQVLIYPNLQALDFHMPSMIQNQYNSITDRVDLARAWSFYMTGDDKLVDVLLKNAHTTQEVKDTVVKKFLSHDLLPAEYKYPPYSRDLPGPAGGDIWRQIGDKILDPYLCPLVAKDLRHLPATYMFTCQYDVLRDDGVLYAQRLQEAGVKVTHWNMLSGFHALPMFEMLPEAEMFFKQIRKYLMKNL